MSQRSPQRSVSAAAERGVSLQETRPPDDKEALSTTTEKAPIEEKASPALSLSTALKGFVATLHKQAERHTDLIDIFARALKELNREVKQERARREIMERNLRQAEGRVERLEQLVRALARQSWVH